MRDAAIDEESLTRFLVPPLVMGLTCLWALPARGEMARTVTTGTDMNPEVPAEAVADEGQAQEEEEGAPEAEEESEHRLRHQIALGLAGVYDVGYDRGFQYGLSYQLSYALLRVTALLALGDTDPRHEQHWSLQVGVQPWSTMRFDAGFHHRTFTRVGFGENLVTLVGRVRWRGLEVALGWVLRFTITDRDRIHSPVVFERSLFEHFICFRLGYIWQIGRGVGLGLMAGTFSRFEIHNLDHPQFAAVLTYYHPRVGRFRLDGGIGTAGFFNMGSTIDRGFLRLEYIYDR